MVYRDVRCGLVHGLHLLAAVELVRVARGFDANVSLRTRRGTFDAKNPLDITKAFIRKGDIVTVVSEGEDERDAARECAHYIEG